MKILDRYNNYVVRSDLLSGGRYGKVGDLPKIKKIVLHVTSKDTVVHSKQLVAIRLMLEWITGQQGKLTKVRDSVASFNIRKGMPIGVLVTLRGEAMQSFLYRLIYLLLPRLINWKGFSKTPALKEGVYSFGVENIYKLPELDVYFESLGLDLGMDVTIVTTAQSTEESVELLTSHGLLFVK